MNISMILGQIDNGQMALPEFQRGYVWNRDQVRALFDSLYHRHPVGSLLVWATKSEGASYRGEHELAPGVVKLLLDGQQRITSLYGVIRSRPPKFFDGNEKAFTDLYFHLDDENFFFYQPIKMADDPLWINVSELLGKGPDKIGGHFTRLYAFPEYAINMSKYIGRLTNLLGIKDINLHVEEIGPDKSLDVVVDIFNRVNSGGTKLSKGDLALAKICADWPEARSTMKTQLKTWQKSGYDFDLDWLLRSVNTVLTGEAKFSYLHDKGTEKIRDGLNRATGVINTALNMISGRLGLDHDRVLFGRFAIPVIAHYLDRRNAPLGQAERDKLLFWYIQAGMWGRFSGSTESKIDQDLASIEEIRGGLDRLIEQLRLWHGSLLVEPGHFFSWSLGARFYPVLYMLTRMGGAKDWGTGLPLKSGMLGKMNTLEVHHIFPKSRLYDHKDDNYKRPEVNDLSNFCFLTKDTNLAISNRLPEEYFLEVEKNHPGSLASQWIPMDRTLWKISNYREFLEVRRKLLAEEANLRLRELLHDDTHWLQSPTAKVISAAPVIAAKVVGGISGEEEEQELEALNKWVAGQGLKPGTMAYEFVDVETGEQKAVFDLAWPKGIQEELSQPVAVLLNEDKEVFTLANMAGYRYFETSSNFRQYVEQEILHNL